MTASPLLVVAGSTDASDDVIPFSYSDRAAAMTARQSVVTFTSQSAEYLGQQCVFVGAPGGVGARGATSRSSAATASMRSSPARDSLRAKSGTR